MKETWDKIYRKFHWYDGRKIAYKKPYYVLEILRKRDMIKFLNEVKFMHQEKIEKKDWALSILTSTLHATQRN
jgi:hypothetical protein